MNLHSTNLTGDKCLGIRLNIEAWNSEATVAIGGSLEETPVLVGSKRAGRKCFLYCFFLYLPQQIPRRSSRLFATLREFIAATEKGFKIGVVSYRVFQCESKKSSQSFFD